MDEWLACEDCEGVKFFVSMPGGSLYCANCHDITDCPCLENHAFDTPQAVAEVDPDPDRHRLPWDDLD